MIRHCEGESNIAQIYNGTTDLDISELGEKQLEKLGERFDDIELSAVYSTHLIRARKTAHAVADRKGLEISIDPQLLEIYGGVAEGVKFSDTFRKYPELKEMWDNHPEDFHPKDGESMRQLYDRVYEAVLRISALYDGKAVAAVSHGGAIRCLLCRLLFGDIKRLKDTPWSKNTDVALLRVDNENKTVSLIYHGDHSHLTEDMLPQNSMVENFGKDQ